MPYIDVTDATFETEVVSRSGDVTVVIDLWAPWCRPCVSLGPIIERVVDGAGDEVILAKVNIDENPRIAQAFQVQSIPAVFAVKDRKVVDSFVGAIPEHQVKAWVAGLAPAKSEAELLIDEGVETQDATKIEAALALEPGNARGVLALAEMRVAEGRNDDALALLAKIPETTEVIRVAALARLGDASSVASDASPEVFAELDELIDRVKTDDEARQRYVDLLAVLGDDPRVPALRKKLAARLY
jgi:putative thioredoxin